MSDFLTDEQMAALEGQNPAPSQAGIISDEEMSRMETGQPLAAKRAPQPTDINLRERVYNAVDGAAKSILPESVYNPLHNAGRQAESGVQGFTQGASFGNHTPDRLGQQTISENPKTNIVGRVAGAMGAGMVGGLAAKPLMAAGSGMAPALGRIATQTGLGMAQGYAQKPAEGKSRASNLDVTDNGWNALNYLPGAIQAGSEVMAPALRSMANSSQLRAVGLTGAKSKNLPKDAGNRMVDEGIWGTKQGMADKVANKYGAVEQEIQDLAGNMDGTVSGDSMAESVLTRLKKYLNPEDPSKVISGSEAGAKATTDVAEAVRKGAAGYSPGTPAQMPVRSTAVKAIGENLPAESTMIPAVPATPGKYGGRGLLALKRAGDSEAFNQSGQMGNSHIADAYRAQADEARTALSNLSEGAMPEALKREQTLLLANRGLNQPAMVPKNPVNLTDIGAGMIGSTTGLPGAGAAVLTSKAAVSPLVQSLFAKGAQASSKLADEVADPMLLQALLGATKANK